MEIKAEQLRIGNWIKSEPLSIPRLNIKSNGYMQITGYGISVLESDTSGKLPWSPIPLTEEILLKCGFEKSLLYDNTYYLTIETLNGSQDLFIDTRANVVIVGTIEIGKFNSLHQLQNLIFNLTNQELNVKL